MRKVLFLSIAIAFGEVQAQVSFREIDSLANTIEMEFVHGDERFPIVVPFGYYGSTAVYSFVPHMKWSALFLFRKRKEELIETHKAIYNLLYNYDYFLVFCWATDSNKLMHTTLPIKVGLNGMSLQYGSTNLNLSSFNYLDGKKEPGPNIVADFNNGCAPIVISGTTLTRVLYYYNGRWLERVERFE